MQRVHDAPLENGMRYRWLAICGLVNLPLAIKQTSAAPQAVCRTCRLLKARGLDVGTRISRYENAHFTIHVALFVALVGGRFVSVDR